MRLSPPPIRLRTETRWALLRAFAPVDTPAEVGSTLDATSVAERLDVAARIGARHGREALAAELGETAGPLLARHREAAARELALDALATELARASREASIPAAVLKFGALRAGGWLAQGSRLAADLDLLAPTAAAEAFQRWLLGHGFRLTGQPGHEHQLPSLHHPTFGSVEVHRHLPGVRAPGESNYATFEDLETRGALTPVETGAARGLLTPVREVLVAHAMAHGLAQHLWAPDAHPPFRSLADLVDLGLAGPEGGEPAGGDLARAAAPWLAGTLDGGEIEAVRALCRALVGGDTDTAVGDGPAGLLGRHLLAGALDPLYRRSLALRRVRPPVGEAAAPRRLGHALTRGLFPPAAELDLIYGPSRTAWRRAALRTVRPFDLAWRALRAGWSRGRLHWGGQRGSRLL